MDKIKLGIVVSEYNFDITMIMLERAKVEAEFLGAEISHILYVPGTFEIPLGVKALLEKNDVDAVVTLGAVIEGETEHDAIIMENAARKIEDLQVEYSKPVALGITGHGMTRLQAMERVEKAREAVHSAVKMVNALRNLNRKI
ncbi:MAG: 6,7-dimethyl-8-ribityllumazine synthase [Thermoplasmata archaeon]